MLSKKPILNAILTFVVAAALVALFNFVLSLIHQTTFMAEIGSKADIIIDVVICLAAAVAGYFQAKSKVAK